MPASAHRRSVGSRLLIAIQALGLSQAEVARSLGVSPSKLGNWIRGDNYPDEFAITQFCDRYNISMDYLYRGRVSAAMASSVADALWAAERAFSQAPEATGNLVP